MRIAFCTVLAALCLSARVAAQGFVNLNFEQAVIEPVYDDGVFAWLGWDLAVPAWSHSEGDDTSIVYYRNAHLGITQAYLLVDPLSPVWSPGALEGMYSLNFRNGSLTPAGGGWVNAFIAQTGIIPPEARSIRLLATGIFRVFVNGNQIPLVSLGGNAYGGDVSAFAGSVAELKILNAARPIGEEVSVPVIADAVEFSPEVIPEPSTLALLSVVGCSLAARLVPTATPRRLCVPGTRSPASPLQTGPALPGAGRPTANAGGLVVWAASAHRCSS